MRTVRAAVVMMSLPILSMILAGTLCAEAFSFAAFCDSRGKNVGVNRPVLGFLVDHLVKENTKAKFVLFPGDMINGSKRDPLAVPRQLAAWKEVMKPVYESPHMVWPKLWPTPGNHEFQRGENVGAYKEAFSDVFMNGPAGEKGLYYSFDHGGSHFVAVNTDSMDTKGTPDLSDDKHDGRQVKYIDWLRRDLAAARGRGVKHIFVFGHQAPFPITEGHLVSGLPNLGAKWILKPDLTYLKRRDAFWKALVDHGVAAYICGDEHAYTRQKVGGVYQIVTGIAGAPLYALNPCHEQLKGMPQLPNRRMKYIMAKRYYKVLGYPHGPGDKCHASNDVKGGSFFGYSVFDVKDDSISVVTWGVASKEGKNTELPAGAKLRVMDRFTIE
ncbi:metallophosphoesterase family protein [Elusimicrobiota bacterium]